MCVLNGWRSCVPNPERSRHQGGPLSSLPSRDAAGALAPAGAAAALALRADPPSASVRRACTACVAMCAYRELDAPRRASCGGGARDRARARAGPGRRPARRKTNGLNPPYTLLTAYQPRGLTESYSCDRASRWLARRRASSRLVGEETDIGPAVSTSARA